MNHRTPLRPFAIIPLLFLPTLSPAATCNGELVYQVTPAIPQPTYPEYWQFGVYIGNHTAISPTECDWHATKNAYTGTHTANPTGVRSDSYLAETHGYDNLGRPIDLVSDAIADQAIFGAFLNSFRRNYGVSSADATLGDILWFDKETAGTDETTYIPVVYCLNYQSVWDEITAPQATDASSTLQLNTFNYNGYSFEDSYILDTQLTAADVGIGGGTSCTVGYLQMIGPGAGYTLRFLFNLNGQLGNEYHAETDTYMTTIQGAMFSFFWLFSLPEDVTCRSASGVFPGCDPQPD